MTHSTIEKKAISPASERQAAEHRLFTVEDAAKYLQSIGATSVTICFVRTLVNSGAIPHVRMGKRFYVLRDALDLWIENHQTRRK